ncbi:MAG: DUF616 domain-containing protein [Paludibacteraceae bacterium]|nr:DUF616 domain-containing protein [Paludibacteraceae bacterium]
MCRLAIYTVITGNYDEIHQPQVVVPGADYFLFTNNIGIINSCVSSVEVSWKFSKTCKYCGKIGVWNVILLDTENELSLYLPLNSYLRKNPPRKNPRSNIEKGKFDNILLSRKVKMLPHLYLDPKYDMSIYLDADMLITDDLTELINGLTIDATMSAFRHSYCHSVREEIDDLIERGVVDKDMAEKQWRRYMEWGFNDDLGITENGILIRRHNDPQVIRLMQLWWREFQNGCLRDQISLMPCLYRLGFKEFRILDGNIHNNKWVEICSHKK